MLPKEVASPVICVIYYPPRGPYRKDLVNYLLNFTDNIRSLYPDTGIIIYLYFIDLDPKWISNSLSLGRLLMCQQEVTVYYISSLATVRNITTFELHYLH